MSRRGKNDGAEGVIDHQSKGHEPSAIRFALPALDAPARLPWPAAVAVIFGLSVLLWGGVAALAVAVGIL